MIAILFKAGIIFAYLGITTTRILARRLAV
jgi:hypothetical protein